LYQIAVKQHLKVPWRQTIAQWNRSLHFTFNYRLHHFVTHVYHYSII